MGILNHPTHSSKAPTIHQWNKQKSTDLRKGKGRLNTPILDRKTSINDSTVLTSWKIIGNTHLLVENKHY